MKQTETTLLSAYEHISRVKYENQCQIPIKCVSILGIALIRLCATQRTLPAII